jgi:hypothetical protein
MRPLGSKLKQEVFVRDDFTCQYCGRRLPVDALYVDHIVPRSRGGEDSLYNLVTACRACNVDKGDRDLSEYLAEAIREQKSYYESFARSISNIKDLLKVECEKAALQGELYNLLYANVITVMETYLSDTLIGSIQKDERCLRNLVQINPEFASKKLSLSDIFERMEKIREEVQEYLLGIIYHNLAKVKSLYECALGITFPEDLEAVFKAIQVRHDIVHRNGKAKDGRRVILKRSDVEILINMVEKLVVHLKDQRSEVVGKFGNQKYAPKRSSTGGA